MMKPRTIRPTHKTLVEEYREGAARKEVPPGWVPSLWAKHLRVRAFLNREFDPEVADAMELWAEAVAQLPETNLPTPASIPQPPDPKRYFAPPSAAPPPPATPSSSPKKTFRY